MALCVNGFTFRTALTKPAKTNFRTFRDQPLNEAGYRSPYSCIAGMRVNTWMRCRSTFPPDLPYSCIAGLKVACAAAACSES